MIFLRFITGDVYNNNNRKRTKVMEDAVSTGMKIILLV